MFYFIIMDLKAISKVTRWGKAASDINSNFNAVNEAVESGNKELSLALGFFMSLQDLRTAYPNPEIGYWAYVGTSFPANYYTWDGTSWIISEEKKHPETIDLVDYIESEEVSDPSIILTY